MSFAAGDGFVEKQVVVDVGEILVADVLFGVRRHRLARLAHLRAGTPAMGNGLG